MLLYQVVVAGLPSSAAMCDCEQVPLSPPPPQPQLSLLYRLPPQPQQLLQLGLQPPRLEPQREPRGPQQQRRCYHITRSSPRYISYCRPRNRDFGYRRGRVVDVSKTYVHSRDIPLHLHAFRDSRVLITLKDTTSALYCWPQLVTCQNSRSKSFVTSGKSMIDFFFHLLVRGITNLM